MNIEHNNENKNCEPTSSNYYYYKGKNYLTSEPKNNPLSYNSVKICAYTVNNETRFPFQRFLMTKDTFTNKLSFPEIQLPQLLEPCDVISYANVMLFTVLELTNYEIYNSEVIFDGFYEDENNLYMFFNATTCTIQVYDVYSNSPLWLILIDEIVNHKSTCQIQIDPKVFTLFISNADLCFLADENDKNYEIPVVCYVAKPENKLNLTYTFGETTRDKSDLFGPYYYFTDFNTSALNCLNKNDSNNAKKSGVVRFAVFQGSTKYIENRPDDPIDDSETKKRRLNDSSLDQNRERNTIRISDHDGNWAKTHDSVYLGDIELDDGTYLTETPLFVMKEYNQQMPLSYHYMREIIIDEETSKYAIV